MTTRAARNQKAYRERQKVMDENRERMAEQVLEVVLGGQNGITLSIVQNDYINFDWGGPQSEYDRVEAYCNAQGYSFGMVKDDVEQLVMKRLTKTRQRQQFAKNMTREDFRRKVFEGGTPTIDVEDGKVNITWDFTPEASALLTLYAEHKGTTFEALIDDVNREWLAKREGK